MIFSGVRLLPVSSNLLIHYVLHHQWLHYIGNELWMDVSISDLVVKKLPDCALKLWTDLLRLITDI